MSPKRIPTNVITGFLGAGKTTAILHILKHKPEDERWAVLVNEFGEIGIDGSLISSAGAISVKEVPGGCMCCASSVPMQVALNNLIKEVNPDHILIEPTGLGHTKDILALLRSEHYDQLLDVRATITLLDVRKLSDERYTQNDTFRQQLYMADVIVANKSDTYTKEHTPLLDLYLENRGWKSSKKIVTAQFGEFPIACLFSPVFNQDIDLEEGVAAHANWVFMPKQRALKSMIPASSSPASSKSHKTITHDDKHQSFADVYQNYSQGFFALGWVFSEDCQFDLNVVSQWLSSLPVERAKAVVNTPEGMVAINMTDSEIMISNMDGASAMCTKIELITLQELVSDREYKRLLKALC